MQSVQLSISPTVYACGCFDWISSKHTNSHLAEISMKAILLAEVI